MQKTVLFKKNLYSKTQFKRLVYTTQVLRNRARQPELSFIILDAYFGRREERCENYPYIERSGITEYRLQSMLRTIKKPY